MLALKQIKPFVQTLKGKRPRHNELPERGEIVRIIDPHSEESHWRVDTVELGTTARVILTSCDHEHPHTNGDEHERFSVLRGNLLPRNRRKLLAHLPLAAALHLSIAPNRNGMNTAPHS